MGLELQVDTHGLGGLGGWYHPGCGTYMLGIEGETGMLPSLVKTGAIPSSLHAPLVCLSSTLLAGSIPERLLRGSNSYLLNSHWTREYIVANGLAALDL
eukprot:6464247-Amphidinium_carterae.1